MPVYGVSHDPFMAKLPRGGGSGRHDRARNTDRSFAHVVVVRISSFPLAAWNEIRRQRVLLPIGHHSTWSVSRPGLPRFSSTEMGGNHPITVRTCGLV